jgi:hypothetical protein
MLLADKLINGRLDSLEANANHQESRANVNKYYSEGRLLLFKLYSALLKRSPIKKGKSYGDWAAKGFLDFPDVSFIVQSHNKSVAVMDIVARLRTYPNAEIVVIDDGSKLKHTKQLADFLQGGNEFMVRANDLYEIVMYDKTIRFANGRFVVLLQDDDLIPDMKWLRQGLNYFEKYPDMVILGGFNGLKFQIDENLKQGSIDKCVDYNSTKFQFVHAVDRAPMIIKKSLYNQYLKHLNLAFAPFQLDDAELCLRAWNAGLKVGWYNADFQSLVAGGMRIWNNKLIQVLWNRNAATLYELYKDSVDEITKKVEEANKSVSLIV